MSAATSPIARLTAAKTKRAHRLRKTNRHKATVRMAKVRAQRRIDRHIKRQMACDTLDI